MAENDNDNNDYAEDNERLEELFKKLKLERYSFCPYCQSAVEFVWVHCHYQCPKCKNVVISCCGES